MQSWRQISLWMDQVNENITPRPSLHSTIQADIAIIGGGFTGLWTAYYLTEQNPELSVVIVEAQTVAFGASGRNGGWLMGEMAGQHKLLEALTPQARHQALNIVHGIPDEVSNVLNKEDVDCDFKKGGVLYVATRYPEQLTRLQEDYKHYPKMGYQPDDMQWLHGDSLSEKIKVEGAEGAIFSPHCARVQPAKLARGLAEVLEKRGVQIFEQSPAVEWRTGQVITENGQIECDWVVPAVEAYGASLRSPIASLPKYHLPVQSLIIATEPLGDDIWQEIGLDAGEVFSDYSRQVTYGQRTADNRMVFGARGSYRFGGKIREDFTLTQDEFNLRRDIMVEMFPVLKDAKITHAWGGNLSMARRFHPHMVKDAQQRFALAGGFGGEGVGATNLAGRTLADFILGKDTELTQMPWVYSSLKHLRTWEREPIPWIGYRSLVSAFDIEDKILNNPNKPSWQRKSIERIADFAERFVK